MAKDRPGKSNPPVKAGTGKARGAKASQEAPAAAPPAPMPAAAEPGAAQAPADVAPAGGSPADANLSQLSTTTISTKAGTLSVEPDSVIVELRLDLRELSAEQIKALETFLKSMPNTFSVLAAGKSPRPRG